MAEAPCAFFRVEVCEAGVAWLCLWSAQADGEVIDLRLRHYLAQALKHSLALGFVQAKPIGIRWMATAKRTHHAVVGEDLAEQGCGFTVFGSVLADDVQIQYLPGDQALDADRVAVVGAVVVAAPLIL